MKKLAWLLLLAAFSCAKHDPEPILVSVPFLTFQGFYGDATDTWIFASDDSGKILDVQQVLSQSAVLSSTAAIPENFTLTIYNHYGDGFPNRFESFAGVQKNSTITLGGDATTTGSPEMPDTLGTARLAVQNCFLDASLGSMEYTDGVSSYLNNNQPSNEVTVKVYQDHPDFLATWVNNDGMPVYSWFEGVQSGDTLIKDFSSFTPFGNTIPLDFEGNIFASLRGHRATPYTYYPQYGFGNFFVDRSQVDYVPRLGYLVDGFDSYTMQVLVVAPDLKHSKAYNKQGSINSSVSFPDYTFSVSDQSIQNFTFDFSLPFTFMANEWVDDPSQVTFAWTLYSEHETPKITEIPSAIREKHSMPELSALKNGGTEIYKYISPYTYSQFIANRLISGIAPTTYEYYTFSISGE